jgi:hypothetical protein
MPNIKKLIIWFSKVIQHPSFISTAVIILLTYFVLQHAFNQPGMFQTHDGEMHIVRSLHFFSELKRGQFPVRMAADLAYQYSYPIFQFFYPLPYYTVAIFQLIGLSTTESWRFSLVLVTFLSLWFFYKWMRCHADFVASLVGTTIFALVPFRFLTLYVTGQIGGYYSLMFAPLIGWGLNKLLQINSGPEFKHKKIQGGVLVATGVAGMILSHLLSVIIFFLPLGVYAAYLLFRKFSWKKMGSLIFWTACGVGVSSFYFLPFLFEKSWVKIGHSILINHRDHWPTIQQLLYSPWGFGYSVAGASDGMSFQIGVALLLSWLISVIILFVHKFQHTKALIFSVITVILFFLMTKHSSVVWEIVTPLKYLQYPWRILAATSVVGSYLSGWIISQLTGKKRALVGLSLLIIAAINIRNYRYPWPLDWKSDQDFLKNTQSYYGSTDISWELMPAGTNFKPNQFGNIISEQESGTVITKLQQPTSGSSRLQFLAESKEPSTLILPIWNYPAWDVKINGSLVEKQTTNKGTIEIKIPSGKSSVAVVLTRTKIQKLADTMSLINIIFLISIILYSAKKTVKNGS